MKEDVIIILNRGLITFDYEDWLDPIVLNKCIILTTENRPFKSVKSVFKVDDIQTSTALRLLKQIADAYNILEIFAHSEKDLEWVCQCRQSLGLETWQAKSAHVFQNKIAMKQFAQSLGIKTADYHVIHTPFDLLDVEMKLGYPFVLKPPGSTGSRGVNVITSKEDLLNYLETSQLPLLAEAYVNLPMFHADGLIIDSQFVAFALSKYVSQDGGALSMIRSGFLGSHTLNTSFPLYEPIKQVVSTLAQASGASVFPFHAEFFCNEPANDVILCEIAARIGGPRIFETFEKVYGLNLHRLWLNAFFGTRNFEPFCVPKNTHAGWLLYKPRGVRVQDFDDEIPFEWVSDYKVKINRGHLTDGAESSADYAFGFSLTAPTPKEAEIRLKTLKDWCINMVRCGSANRL